MGRFVIVLVALGVLSCSPVAASLNKKEIEAQIANCGLKFTDPVWELREKRRTLLKMTVSALDLVSNATVQCVTEVSVANNIESQMNAGGDQGK